MDARVNAWVCSWKLIEGVQKCKQDHPEIPLDKYDSSLYEAEILAALANSPEDVGMGAALYLDSERVEKVTRRERNKKLLDKVLDGR